MKIWADVRLRAFNKIRHPPELQWSLLLDRQLKFMQPLHTNWCFQRRIIISYNYCLLTVCTQRLSNLLEILLNQAIRELIYHWKALNINVSHVLPILSRCCTYLNFNYSNTNSCWLESTFLFSLNSRTILRKAYKG